MKCLREFVTLVFCGNKQCYSLCTLQVYVKPVKQITFLYHLITVTSGMTDCSDDQLEEFKLESVHCGEIYLQEKCVLEKS